MSEENQKQEKDHFVLYVALVTVALVGTLLLVKQSESDKFAPIKDQINEENQQMNIRVISQRGDE